MCETDRPSCTSLKSSNWTEEDTRMGMASPVNGCRAFSDRRMSEREKEEKRHSLNTKEKLVTVLVGRGYTLAYTHKHTHTRAHTHMNIYTNTHSCTHTHTHTFTYAHLHKHTLTHIYTHTHTHTHTHACTPMCTHIHIHAHSPCMGAWTHI